MSTPTRRPVVRTVAGAALLGLAATVLAACSPTPAGPSTAAQSAPAPSEGELTPGWDEPGDSPVVPDTDLSAAEVTALLRVTATGPLAEDSCAPEQVAVALTGFDAAMGHRDATVEVRNTSDVPCTLTGYPGIGARGERGDTFLLVAEQSALGVGTDPSAVVALAPGGAAGAPLEWTGELAGAESQWLSSLAVQLAPGQAPALLVKPRVEDGEGGVHQMDITLQTTVRVGPFAPVG